MIEICIQWVFCKKFNFRQLLFEAFFDIIWTFGRNQVKFSKSFENPYFSFQNPYFCKNPWTNPYTQKICTSGNTSTVTRLNTTLFIFNALSSLLEHFLPFPRYLNAHMIWSVHRTQLFVNFRSILDMCGIKTYHAFLFSKYWNVSGDIHRWVVLQKLAQLSDTHFSQVLNKSEKIFFMVL